MELKPYKIALSSSFLRVLRVFAVQKNSFMEPRRREEREEEDRESIKVLIVLF